VLDAFYVIKVGNQAVDEVRRRVQQAILGHCGRKDDPLYRIRNVLRTARERLTVLEAPDLPRLHLPPHKRRPLQVRSRLTDHSA
jgi:transposase